MERYTQWRDKATGISPFLPILHTNVIGTNESSFGNFIKVLKLDVIVKFLLFVIRTILVLPLVFMAIFMGGMSIRMVMLIAGLTSYELSVQNLKTKNLNKSFYPSKNDVFLVNFTSPLDLILLKLISNDGFVILMSEPELRQISHYYFIKKSLGFDYETTSIDYNKIKDKVIYIFPEGTTSNGKSILPFSLTQDSFNSFIQILNKDGKIHKIKTLGIKVYPSTLVTPIQYSPVEWIYKLLTTLTYSAKIRINIPNELDQNETNLIKIRNSFMNNGKFKLISLDLNIDAKRKFIETYVGRR